ncbi:MAG: PDZ domain-containing protein [Terracidiphilus sp.]
MHLLMKLTITTAGAAVVAACLAAQTTAPPPSFRFSTNEAAEGIPVEVIANGLVLVHGNVNDHPGWFIVDNAVQGFVADRDYARQISLQESGKALTRGEMPNPTEAGIVRDVRIALPGFELTHRVLIVIDLKSLEPAIGHEVDGIIGSRLFDDFVVKVDYQHSLMSVYAPNGYQPPDDEKPIPVRVDEHGFQFIEATIVLPGVAPITAEYLIDSGANSNLEAYKPFCDEHRLPPPGMKLLDAPGTSAGATTKSTDGRADRIEVGSFSVKNPPISFGEDVAGLMASKDHAGLIGAAFLQDFTVVYDSRGKRILLAPNRNYEDPPRYDQSGLRIHAEGPSFHTFVVGGVLSGSPAAEAGIEPGDIIESLDRKSSNELTLTKLRNMLTGPNARYSVRIIRGKRLLRIKLQLRPLL